MDVENHHDVILTQLLTNQLDRLTVGDTKDDSYVKFEIGGNYCLWKQNSNFKWRRSGDIVKYNGLYEGSLFYGTRFKDSTNIEQMIASGQITEQEITDAVDLVIRLTCSLFR